jgi:hypothetical protein
MEALKEKLLGPDDEEFKPPSNVKRIPQAERVSKALAASATQVDKVNPKVAEFLRLASPVLTYVIMAVLYVAPLYAKVYKVMYRVYCMLPTNVLKMVFGATLCFFGGTYVAAIAAVEACRTMGGANMMAHINFVWSEIKTVQLANQKDDYVDADGDGIADVDQISATDLAKRKMLLAMTSVSEPQRLQNAIGALWATYIAVLATLRLEFARTTALALGIVEVIKLPVVRLTGPLVSSLIGPKLIHWTDTIIDTTISFIAVVFAWYLQMVISAWNSALRGGRIFADALFNILIEKGWLDKCPDWLVGGKPFDLDKCFLDEIVMALIAGGGLFFQLSSGFNPGFIINVLLFPLTIIEWFLRWQISMGA